MTLIKINVGGTLFMTDSETLSKITYFKKLLESEMKTKVVDTDGNIFVDRDPILFRQLLNDARNNRVTYCDTIEMGDELKFYCMDVINKKICLCDEFLIDGGKNERHMIYIDKNKNIDLCNELIDTNESFITKKFKIRQNEYITNDDNASICRLVHYGNILIFDYDKDAEKFAKKVKILETKDIKRLKSDPKYVLFETK